VNEFNAYDLVNTRSLSPGCTPNPSQENPIRYKGWDIYKWTGWKGNTDIAGSGSWPVKSRKLCAKCLQVIKAGDAFVFSQQVDDIFHFACSDNTIKGQIFGQWLAFKKVTDDHNNWGFAYGSAPGFQGGYRPGDAFELKMLPGQVHLMVDSPQEAFEAAREEALRRLKEYIDSVEK
jgi:hypothetical protein